MDDRRKYKRVLVDLMVMYDASENNANYDQKLLQVRTPVLENISLSGMKVVTDQQLPAGLKVRIILSAWSRVEYIEIIGKVVWSCILPADMISTGIEFIEFTGQSQELLQELVGQAATSKD